MQYDDERNIDDETVENFMYPARAEFADALSMLFPEGDGSIERLVEEFAECPWWSDNPLEKQRANEIIYDWYNWTEIEIRCSDARKHGVVVEGEGYVTFPLPGGKEKYGVEAEITRDQILRIVEDDHCDFSIL